jgi:hypothetical protein
MLVMPNPTTFISSLFKSTRKKSKSKSKSKSNSFTRKRNLIATQFLTNIRKTIKQRQIIDNLHKESSAQKIQESFKTTLAKSKDANVCSICLAKMLFPRLISTLPCGHKFHAKCIKPVIDNDYNARCPLCRAPIPVINQNTNQTINGNNIGLRHTIYRTSRNRRTSRQSHQTNIASLHIQWTRLSRAVTNARTKWQNQRIKAHDARERANHANFLNRARLTQIAEREELLLLTYLAERDRRIRERLRFERRHEEILTEIITNSRTPTTQTNLVNVQAG